MSQGQVEYAAGDTDRRLRAIVGIDQQVPLLNGPSGRYVNLDNAASTPAFQYVQSKVDEFLPWYSSVHRGSGFKSLLTTEVYEQARAAVARFLNADPETSCVIFGKNATEGINKLANRMGLCPDDVVICTEMEHHSNDLPWRARAHVEYARLKDDGTLDIDSLARELDRHTGRVKLVAVTGASNVTGFMPPIYEIAELTHRHGARVLVDCAQLAPHRAIDVGPADSPSHLDFVVLSAHKMYAPFGTGVLLGPKEVFEEGPPDYSGGGTIEIVNLGQVHWTEPPERDEAGSPNVVGAVALAASIHVLTAIGMDVIEAHERELTSYLLCRLGRMAEVKVYGSSNPDRLDDRLGVVAFEVAGVPHGKVAAILGFEGGIGVRDGCFCANPYVLQLLGITDPQFHKYKERVLNHNRSALPGLVRASFGCYNTFEEIDHLVVMLGRIITGDYVGDYVEDEVTGSYYPKGFDAATLQAYYSVLRHCPSDETRLRTARVTAQAGAAL
jgi:cysteine desulfurase/selenocysteine lyase